MQSSQNNNIEKEKLAPAPGKVKVRRGVEWNGVEGNELRKSYE